MRPTSQTISTNPINPTRTVWVIGGGKFGRISALAVRRRWPDAAVTVVDTDGEACRRLEALGFQTVRSDGVRFLTDMPRDPAAPDWIVPVVPVHLAFEWVRVKLPAHRPARVFPVPREIHEQTPNPLAGPGGELYVSMAGFQCPENCPEPPGVCFATGEPRPVLLFEHLAGVRFGDFRSVVVRSHQLSPGVGGFRPAALFRALQAVMSAPGPVLLSTACSCHGVMHALGAAGKMSETPGY